MNIEEEALKYFTKHYPLASREEIKKQIEDWRNKINVGKKLTEFFKERVGAIENKKILDVGFGSGGIAIAFNKVGAEMFGVDVGLELKEIAQKNALAHNAKVDFRIYAGASLPFEDNYFDYLICLSVLEHVNFPDELLNEMLRVLKPQGRILLTLPNKYYPKETHTLAYFISWMPRKLANWYLKILKRSPLEYDNLHFYSYFDILKMLNKTNYEFEILYKSTNQMSGFKKILILALKRVNIHYTAFLRQLMFIVEKK